MELDPRRRDGETPGAYEARVHAPARVHRTPMDGGMLAWHEWGDEAAAALVLLHGGFGSWRHFILNVTALAREFRVLCADLPGLGDSDLLAGEYSADRIADAVLTGIDARLGADAIFALAGFSFGGIIGAHVAALAGARVRRFVAVAPGALGVTMNRPELASLGNRRDAQAVDAIHRVNLGRLMIADPQRVDDLAVHVQRETVRRARARSGSIPWTDVAARALRRCRCPIAGVWGALDCISVGHLDEREALFRGIQPDCPFEVVDGAGHWVMYEQPARFNRLLRDVLAR